MPDVAALEKQFGIPNVLRFEQSTGGLATLHITAPSAEATIYLQGAHVTHWKPTGHDPAIFLSERAEFVPGKPIRGGIPIVFPWFGDRHDGKQGPQHGFARISEWELAFAALSNDEVHLAFALAPNDLSRSLGFDHFRLGYRVTVGQQLRIEMSVVNDSGNGSGHDLNSSAARAEMAASGAPLVFEQALHTYYQVADARHVSIEGLDGTEFIDKVDNLERKIQDPGPLRLAGRVDRPYLNTEATCVLRDPMGHRAITVAKQGSHSTVIWNPWQEFTAKMPDMQPDAWLRMTCIETANVGDNAITLHPGEKHIMRMTASMDKE